MKMGYIAENPRKLENAFRFLPFFCCTVLNYILFFFKGVTSAVLIAKLPALVKCNLWMAQNQLCVV